MTFSALVNHFSTEEDLPVMVNPIMDWVREHTDHKIIRLHPVSRKKKAARGACWRRAMPTPGAPPYSGEYEIVTEILYGEDLPLEWQRLVIVKELLHVFDPSNERVSTQDGVRKLITSVIAPEIKTAPFMPAINDHLGAFRAMAVLLPRAARIKLATAYDDGSRSISEIAGLVKLPEHYVDIWLQHGGELEPLLCGRG